MYSWHSLIQTLKRNKKFVQICKCQRYRAVFLTTITQGDLIYKKYQMFEVELGNANCNSKNI